MGHIFVEGTNGGLGNQIFPLMAGISHFYRNLGKFEKPLYFCNENNNKLNSSFINSLDPDAFKDLIESNFDSYGEKVLIAEKNRNNLKQVWSQVDIQYLEKSVKPEELGYSIMFSGYLQEARIIDEKTCQKHLKPSKSVIKKITDQFKDINDMVCLQVRRGDYLSEKNLLLYVSITEDWIDTVVKKYFPDKKIICISDDPIWCKKTLIGRGYEIVFPQNLNTVEEFWLQTLTFGNICSPSSFSLAGAMLNPNLNSVITNPYYKLKSWEDSIGKLIIPDWIKREPINVEMTLD